MKIISDISKKLCWALTALCTFAITSCDDGTSGIGQDLVDEEVSVVVDSSFTITGQSVVTDAVLSRTVVQLLGIVDVPEYGYMSSDVVTQFMPAVALDTTGVTVNDIDSLKLVMLVNPGSFVGDSLALMGVDVYPLNRQLQTPIYSNFNPDGYYDASKKLGSLVYNLTKSSEPDSLQSRTYFTLSLDLPLSLGRDLYSEYIANPSTFSSPSAFARFFPGLYLKNSYGSGRITRIGNTTIRMYYHQHAKTSAGNDTTYNKVGNYFAVTPEIITNNDITLAMSPEVDSRVARGEAIMLAPAGLEVEFKFPVREIMSRFRTGTADGLGVVNLLSLRLPVLDIENKYNITAPNDVLLVLKKDREKFFLNNNLADNKTSFLTSLTTFSDGSKGYLFSDMRQYIVDLLAKETVDDDDLTFMLVPVATTVETNNDYYGNPTTTLTAITPYVAEPKMTQILFEKAKINFVFSLQSTKF